MRSAPEPSRARVGPDQCRQARDILKWTPRELAEAAAVTPWVIAAFEEGREVSPAHEEAIWTALEAVGIGFPFEIANGRARPAGVPTRRVIEKRGISATSVEGGMQRSACPPTGTRKSMA